MNEQNVKIDRKRELPVWAEQVRQKYLAGEASVFVLYGNVFDRYLVDGTAYAMTEFLADVLLKDNKTRIMEVSLGRGVRFLQDASTATNASMAEKETLYSFCSSRTYGSAKNSSSSIKIICFIYWRNIMQSSYFNESIIVNSGITGDHISVYTWYF